MERTLADEVRDGRTMRNTDKGRLDGMDRIRRDAERTPFGFHWYFPKGTTVRKAIDDLLRRHALRRERP